MKIESNFFFIICCFLIENICLFSLQRPPSSSLSYGGHGNDDVRSPGSGGTPGPLSQPPSSQALDHNDPGKLPMFSFFLRQIIN